LHDDFSTYSAAIRGRDPRIYLEKMNGRVKPGDVAVVTTLSIVIIRESG
jgi:hypothetical protein